ncbi:hypothetical protein GGX14DRAFT_401479 [Mycena pura]|uniref:Uncharacterized protein n=1 Tax=Mycena pura TaxID=153505 RepID=A0AAD6UZS4_9AGAR|nr:hypothetical protein GGX14DRAFT_401479 [Mycena pura]
MSWSCFEGAALPSQMARRIRRPISESAADVAAQCELNIPGYPYFGTEGPNYEPIWDVRWLGGSASPYQNPRLMLLLRNVQITNQFGMVNLVVWADLCHTCSNQSGSAGPYQNPRLMLLLRNVQITNQFGTVNLIVWPDLCHSSQIARKIRRPISESAADVAAQIRWLGGSTGPYQNPRLMLLLRVGAMDRVTHILEQNVQITNQFGVNVQITNQFGALNLVVWPDLCHCSQIARKIRRPISESAADVAAQKCRQNPRLMLLLRLSGLTCATRAPTSQMARRIRRPISESAADVAAQTTAARSQGRSAGPYQNPWLMLLLRNVQITNQFGTVNLVVWPDLCHCSQIARKIRQPISESAADVAAQTRSQGRSADPYQNPRLMLLPRNVQITNQFGTVNLVVWADLCHSSPIARKIRQPISESAADVAAQKCPNYEPIWHVRWLGGSAGPYQNPRLMLLLRNVQITNQFGTVNLVVWPDLCHSSPIARKIRRPISESVADVAAQTRSQGRSAGPYQNPRLMLLLRNVQITNQFGMVNLVVWPDLCHSSPIARNIRRPISESVADVAAQIRWLGGSAGPYQNPRLMLLLRVGAIDLVAHILEQNVQITNQFGMVNLVVWPDLCHSSPIARKIRRPISESAADVAAQTRSQGRSADPYQNPWLMLLLRVSAIDLVTHILEHNVQITNQFGTVNLVVWADLCHSSPIARKIRRPISESAADVAAQKCPNYEPIWHVRWLGGSAGPYQNPRLMLLLRVGAMDRVTHILEQNVQITNQFGVNVQITNQFGALNLVVWPDLCHCSQIARKIRRPISESAADVAAQKCRQNPRLMLLLRNVQITNQFGTVNLVVWADLCHSSPIARKIRQPISESAADVAAQKCPNYEPIWHVRWLGGSAGPYQNPRLMLLLRNVQITNQFGTVNLVVWPDLCHSSQIARKIRRPISESAADVAAQTTAARSQGRSAGPYQNPWLMLLLRNVQITNQFGTVNLVVWPDLCHCSQIARKIRQPISESAADVAAQTRSQGRSAGPYQNPRLMLLPRNVQITNQFGTVNLVVWADLCHSSPIARKIRRPISESAADVAAQKCPNYEPIWHVRWLGGSAGPYQNPRLMLLLRNVQITNQFGTVNLVVWPDLCHSSQIARKIRRPISESAADVAAQTTAARSQGRSAGPYQNPWLMLLLRNVQITNQFGTVNLVVWPDLCHCSQIARKIRQPISESAADVAAQTRSQGRSAGPYQNPRLMLLPRNVQITNQFGTVNLVVWADLCHSSPIARKIRRPISESAADVAAQKCPNYEPIWHVRWLGGSAGPYQNPRLMLLLRNVQITNQFGTVNLVVWPDLCHSSPIARKIRRPISESVEIKADVGIDPNARSAQGRSGPKASGARNWIKHKSLGSPNEKCGTCEESNDQAFKARKSEREDRGCTQTRTKVSGPEPS